MPLYPDEFYAYALDAMGAEDRLTLSRLTAWEIFPFESDDLRVVPRAFTTRRKWIAMRIVRGNWPGCCLGRSTLAAHRLPRTLRDHWHRRPDVEILTGD
jgi:hypothetical protein